MKFCLDERWLGRIYRDGESPKLSTQEWISRPTCAQHSKSETTAGRVLGENTPATSGLLLKD